MRRVRLFCVGGSERVHGFLRPAWRGLLQRLRARVLLLRRRQLRAVLQPPDRVHRPRRALRARRRALPRERPRPRRALHRHPRLHRDQLRGLRDGRHAVLPAHPQPAPPADLLRRPGPRPRRPRAGPEARPAGGELPPHRRAVGPHRPVLRGVPRRARHGVGRPAAAQPVPGVEPLLRRQSGARPGAEDRIRAAAHVRAATAGEGAAGPAQGRAATPWPGPSTTGSGGASAPARSTTR